MSFKLVNKFLLQLHLAFGEFMKIKRHLWPQKSPINADQAAC